MNAVALAVVVAQREQLLELVDDEQPVERPRAPPWLGARGDDVGVPRRGADAGPQHRRLAAARRADDGDERVAREPLDEVGDDGLAAEVAVRVVGPEREEARVRALGGWRRRVDARRGEREDVLRLAPPRSRFGPRSTSAPRRAGARAPARPSSARRRPGRPSASPRSRAAVLTASRSSRRRAARPRRCAARRGPEPEAARATSPASSRTRRWPRCIAAAGGRVHRDRRVALALRVEEPAAVVLDRGGQFVVHRQRRASRRVRLPHRRSSRRCR